MNRRSFLALASGLLVPTPDPVRRYFFAPAGGWGHQRSWLDCLGDLYGMDRYEGEAEVAFRQRLRGAWELPLGTSGPVSTPKLVTCAFDLASMTIETTFTHTPLAPARLVPQEEWEGMLRDT